MEIRLVILKALPIFFLLTFCASSKEEMNITNHETANARLLAIEDFVLVPYETPKRYLNMRNGNPFDVFWIHEYSNRSSIVVFSFTPENQGYISLGVGDTLGQIPKSYFPNKYIIVNDKLFIWKDDHTPLNGELLNILDKFGVLDSTDVKMAIGTLPSEFDDTRLVLIDHDLKSVNYHICKSEIQKFKKVTTNKAHGSYKHPRLNCYR